MTTPTIDNGTDYNVKVSVRNGRLLSRIRAAGYGSVSAFCRAHGLPVGSVQGLVGLKVSGMKNLRDEWRSLVIQISDILQCMPDDIIPEQHRHGALKTNTFELGLTGPQAAELVGHAVNPDTALMHAEARRVLDAKLAKIPARIERVLRMRFGLCGDGRIYTLDEISDAMGFTRERVRQIEFKGFEKLRGRDRNKQRELHSYIADLAADE